MNYLLRAIFILSFVALVISSLITWQQWSPFAPGYPDQRNFLRTTDHVNQAAKFLFFASALAEAWAGSLDKRISFLALGALIVERFAYLADTEKSILLGVALSSVVLLLLLWWRGVKTPTAPRPTTRPVRSSAISADSARLYSTVDTAPVDTEEPQPSLRWSKAKRLMNFIAFGDLDAKRARSGHAK